MNVVAFGDALLPPKAGHAAEAQCSADLAVEATNAEP